MHTNPHITDASTPYEPCAVSAQIELELHPRYPKTEPVIRVIPVRRLSKAKAAELLKLLKAEAASICPDPCGYATREHHFKNFVQKDEANKKYKL